MNNNFYLRLLFLTAILISCRDHFEIEIDQNGAVLKTSHLWTKHLVNEGDELFTFITPFELGETVTLMGADFKEQALRKLDINNGNQIWEWNEFNFEDRWDVYYYHSFDNKLIVPNGANFYSIDIKTGQTIWKEKLPYQVNRSVAGYRENYFFSGYLYEIETRPTIFKGNLYTGEYAPFLIPNIDSLFLLPFVNVTGYVEEMITFVDYNGEAFLLIPFLEFISSEKYSRYLSLFNITKNQYVFDKILISDQGTAPFQGQPKIYSDKIYLSCAERLYCLNLYTGEKIWDYPFEHGLFRYIIDENTGIVIASGENTYTYGFNAWSGNLLWEEKSAGRPSELKILNGIVYFTTGGDGRLHAVDIQSGKHIWKLKCPDKNYDPSYPFKSDGVAVFQGKKGKKGKIIASGFINAYCYEAIR